MKKFILQKMYLLLYSLGYRIINIPAVVRGIGHQIIEPVSLIRLKKLKLCPFKIILFYSVNLNYSKDKEPYSNHSLIRYLKPFFSTIVFEYPINFYQKIKFLLMSPFLYPDRYGLKIPHKKNLTVDFGDFMARVDRNARMFELEGLYPGFQLKIKKSDQKYGQKVLKTLGIPDDAWFVSFHVRTQNFYQGIDFENNYNNRCTNIDSYFLALKEIVNAGGYCIYIGEDKHIFTEKLKELSPYVININDVDCSRERISPFLFSQCTFFIGCNSGPSIIPGVFGVPTVQVQTSPFWGIPLRFYDLFIFKKLWDRKKKRFLTLEELFSVEVCQTNLDYQFEQLNLDVIDNTPEEVQEVVTEMMDLLFKTPIDQTDNDERQKLFKSLFPPQCYARYSTARVGRKYLKRLVEANKKDQVLAHA